MLKREVPANYLTTLDMSVLFHLKVTSSAAHDQTHPHNSQMSVLSVAPTCDTQHSRCLGVYLQVPPGTNIIAHYLKLIGLHGWMPESQEVGSFAYGGMLGRESRLILHSPHTAGRISRWCLPLLPMIMLTSCQYMGRCTQVENPAAPTPHLREYARGGVGA